MKNKNTKNKNKTWFIYRHICRATGFSYIGQTSALSAGHRWGIGGRKYRTQKAFWSVIQEFGWDNFDHEILEEGIKTLKEANERETYWISYYHTWIGDPECRGYNTMRGGDNNWYIASDETREKMRQAKLGKFHTDEYKRELSKIFGGREIICIETQQVYLGQNEAGRQTGIRHIGECCRHDREIAGGYHWAFIDDLEWQDKFRDFVGKERHLTKLAKRPVRCIETGKTFESALQAETITGIGSSNIRYSLKTGHATKGTHWEYLDD